MNLFAASFKKFIHNFIKKYQTILHFLIILPVVFFCFSPCLDNDFTNWDDDSLVTANKHVFQLNTEHFKEIFTSKVMSTYVPLTILSFSLEKHFYQYNPYVFHLDNLLLHLGVIVLLYVFLKKLGFSQNIVFLAVFFFALHPLRVESVAWVAERKTLLYSIFFLLALNQYYDYVKNKRSGHYWLSVFFCLMSILAKSMALTLPLILFLVDWFLDRKWDWKLLWEKVPYAAVILPVAYFTYQEHAVHYSPYLLNGLVMGGWIIAFYLSKLVFPQELVPLYATPKFATWPHAALIGLILLWPLAVAAIFVLRKHKEFLFSFLWFLISISFFLIFFLRKRFEPDMCIVADRFMYIAGIGFSLGVALLVERIFQVWGVRGGMQKACVVLAVVVLLSVYGTKTYRQCDVWQNSLRLWNAVLAKFPDHPIALANRANALFDRGGYTAALADIEKALAIVPYSQDLKDNRAVILKRIRIKEGIADE